MDGSYNQPYGHGHGSSHINSPQTPSSATYQTNVNRSKTRKWVEARQQTYDGDDWGNDDFEEEPDSPPNQQQPPVPANTRLASYGQRTPSTTVASDPANPPALHIPSQHAAPPAQVAHYPAGPSYPQEQPAAGDSSHMTGPGNFASHQDSSDFQSSNAPLQQAPAPSFPAPQPAAPAYVDHTDHFGRVERKNTTRKPVGGSKPLAEGAAIDAPPMPEKPEEHMSTSAQDEVPALRSAQQTDDPELSRAEDIDRHRLSTSPQLPDVARMSAFGLDLFAGNPRRVSAMAPPPPVEEAESPAPVTGTSVEPITENPDVSSIEQDSVPAENLPTSAAPLATATMQPDPSAQDIIDRTEAAPTSLETTNADVPSHMWRPSVPGEQSISDEPTAPASVAQPQDNDVSPISEHSPEANTVPDPEPAHMPQHKPTTLLPSTDEPTVAPLRTPSPRVSQIAPIATTSANDDSRAELEPLHTNPPTAAPVEPLEARIPEYSPSDYDPKSLQREATFSTVASSPLKESDILRDEIIKSLSPQNETAPANFPPPVAPEPIAQPAKSAPRDSTYTLSGYDSYWAEKDRGAQPTTSQREGEPKTFETVPEEEPTMPTPKQTAALPIAPTGSQTSTPGDADARRRFSWEMAGEEAAPAPAAPTEDEDKVLNPATQQTTHAADPTIRAPGSEASPGVNVVVDAPQDEEFQQVPEGSAGVSHQVSQASSTRPTGQAQLATPEPPSPVSDPSERVQASATEDRRPSLTEQKSLVRSEATPVAPSPPSGTHPALASSPTASQTPGAQAPLMTFREIMGLSSAQERISKYDEARTRFATIESGLSDWIANLKASHPDHTNASASFGGSLIPQGGDPSTIPSPVGGQAPPQQPYYQQYLNASSPTTANPPGRSRLGGLSSSGQSGSAFGHSSDKIGTKSKELMQTAGKMGKGLFSKGKSKLRGTGDKQADASPPTTPVQGKTKTDRRSSWALSLGNRSRTEGMGLHSNAGQPAIGHSPQPSTTTGRLSTANTGHGTDHGSLRGPHSRSGPQGFDAQNQAANRPPATPDRAQKPGHSRDVSLPLTLDKDADESTWDPFNGTPYARRKSPAPSDVLPSEPNDHDTRVSGDWVVVPRENTAPRAPHAIAEDSGIGMSSQPEGRPSGLKRDASFGLPLIRRSTTLDFGLKDALGTDDQSDGRQAQQSTNNDRSLSGEDRMPGGAAVMQPPEPTSQVQQTMITGGPSTSQNNEFTTASQSNAQSPVRAQERAQAQASLPLLQTENPKQQAVTPPGPWKLEESYLSEPLHQVSRKRSGTDDSQQLTFGMDKEMGFTASSPISPPTMGPRQRSGNQLPPSSAQRYPELFTNTQPQNGPRGRSNSGSNMAGPGFPRTESNEFDIPGVGPPEERGRRKSSSIFKEFGNRLGRASSRDRRPSISDSRPTTSEVVRHDGGSETNVWTDNLPEKRKKRASLLNGLRSRPSMEMASQGNELKPENGPTVIQSQVPGPSASQNALPLPSEEERKSKAGFGPDIMKLRSAKTEKWDSNGPEEQQEQNAGKSRLSGLGGKVAGFAGAFRRPTMEQSNQSTASVAANDFNEEARRTSQQQASGETQEGRGRRGSAAGMISGLLGRSSSRSRQQQQQHPGQQPYGESGNNQPYAGRASMDQRPSVADTLARDPPPQASVRPVGRSPPPPEAPRKDSAAANDAGRFETVSPELSVRSGPQHGSESAMGSGQVGTYQEPKSSMPQGSFGNMSQPPPMQASSSDPANYGPPPQGYYAPRPQQHVPPHGQQQMHQPMHMQQMQSRPSFGPPKPQSTELLRQQSNQQDSLNIPGSRHSSISLQSSNQGRPQSGDGQQSSRWRGFKNRISAQLAPQGQEKGGEKEERSSSSKLFGALKRTSKQSSSPPVSMHQNASHSQQWAPPQQSMPQAGPQGYPQHMMAQGPPHMTQRMAPMQHQQQQQQHFVQPQGQPQRPGMGPNPYDSFQRQPSSVGTQSFQQQPMPQTQGPPPHIPGNRQLPPGQGPPGQDMQYETQYEQVPIPAAYGAALGQGHVFNMDRQMRNYNTSFQYNNGVQPLGPEQRHQGSPQPSMYGQPNGQPNGSTTFAKQVPGPSQSPNAFDNARFGGAQATSPPPPERITSIASAGQTSPQKTAVSPAASPPPASGLPPPPSNIGRPDYVRGDSEVLPTKSDSITRKPTNPSVGAQPHDPRTPVTAAQRTDEVELKNPANLSVDVAKAEADKEEDIYDATPRVVQGKMGQKSPEPVAQSPTPPTKTESATKAPPKITTGKKVPPAAGASFAMELEDTEEARKRTIRLDSQEEKIYYDPADDDDNPTMSATSYPGQEWNPYGEFDYSDVGDEPQHESVRGR